MSKVPCSFNTIVKSFKKSLSFKITTTVKKKILPFLMASGYYAVHAPIRELTKVKNFPGGNIGQNKTRAV